MGGGKRDPGGRGVGVGGSVHSCPLGNDEPLWRLNQVSSYLAASSKAILRLARSGQLPGIKVGHDWRFRRADLERFVRQRLYRARRGVNKPLFFRVSVLNPYRANQRDFYLHEEGFHGRLGLREGWYRQKLHPHSNPLPSEGEGNERGEFCELPFWKVPVTQEFIVLNPKDFRKLPRAVQDHWRDYLVQNQDIQV